jgi:Cys-rich protein (TIGR01571 family)
MSQQPLVGGEAPVSVVDRLKLEVSTGGANQALGLDQQDWGGNAGKFFECWKLEPCCGEPCNPRDGCLCCVHFTCCGICTNSRLLASKMNQTWSCWPHVLCFCCCQLCSMSALRYNIRRSHGVPGNICGDCICQCCCNLCATTQMIRSLPRSDWQWLENFQPPAGSYPDLKFVN